MKSQGTYIKITDNVDEEDISPSKDELILDKYTEEEYNTPYISYNEDLPDFGGSIKTMGIFDDR